MADDLIPFAFEDQLIRTVLVDGEPWFVAKDVCRALDLNGDPGQHTRRLDDDEKGLITNQTPGGEQQIVIVSEAGVYRLVFTSRKPEAERFKRWLAHDVLPALRRTGRYEMPGRSGARDTGPEAPLPEEPIATLAAKLSMVREARLAFGPRAARDMWSRVGLPALPEALRPTAAADGAAEGQAALAHLLAQPAAPLDETFGDLMAAALDGAAAARAALAERGLRMEEEAVWIASRGAHLAAAFADTRWDGAWSRAWRGLPGAAPGARVYKVDRVATRGWSIPADHIRAAMVS